MPYWFWFGTFITPEFVDAPRLMVKGGGRNLFVPARRLCALAWSVAAANPSSARPAPKPHFSARILSIGGSLATKMNFPSEVWRRRSSACCTEPLPPLVHRPRVAPIRHAKLPFGPAGVILSLAGKRTSSRVLLRGDWYVPTCWDCTPLAGALSSGRALLVRVTPAPKRPSGWVLPL